MPGRIVPREGSERSGKRWAQDRSGKIGDGERSLRKDGYPGVGAESGEFVAYGGADVIAGIEVSGLEGLGGNGGVDLDACAPLDEGLDLSLPLFWPDEAWGGEETEDFLR
jgi:hypothetical protein